MSHRRAPVISRTNEKNCGQTAARCCLCSTTQTLLPRTCAAANTWTQVTASVVAGHSYTLTLVNHDDNFSSDPTYTRFDDVGLS
ncbi:MAG: hypothetical protein E6I84_16395 [Chloroflexi bacterium]|nr:MAG: hypothetical protein E6I84_16395 [Chloroflexota bacterium]